MVFFLLFKRKTKEKSTRVIFYYLLYGLLNDVLGAFLQKMHSENFFILYAFFTVAEFTFFCVFYYFILPPGGIKKSIFFIWLLFFLFALTDFFLVNNMDAFDSFTIGVEATLIILMCIYYLVVQIKSTNNLFVYSTTNFWIAITFLIYMSGTFFLYIMAESMLNDKAFQIQYIVINAIFNILKNILFSVAMLMKSSQVTPQMIQRNNHDDLLSFKLKK